MNPTIPEFLTEILFAPGQHPHSIGVVIVPTLAEMHQILGSSGGSTPHIIEAGGGPPRAAFFCDYDSQDKTKLGFVIFAGEALSPAIMVHELTHAASFFVTCYVMTSAAVRAKAEEEQQDYYEEAIAYTIEALFQQLFEFVYTAAPLRHRFIP